MKIIIIGGVAAGTSDIKRHTIYPVVIQITYHKKIINNINLIDSKTDANFIASVFK